MPRVVVEEVFYAGDSVLHVLLETEDDMTDDMADVWSECEGCLEVMCRRNVLWKARVNETREGVFLGRVIGENDVRGDDSLLWWHRV